ncbi:ADP-ribosyltransferase exoenzyme [Mycobacterium marinum]|uniref:ADP-ribosyltransferase n=1 Tax=Mycobacterium marinum TaxID=1781 RepID=UPI000E3DE185|nr:ADP-ribosyltransferase [Mycobacterium marinum]RFZ10368.1 ADP-ribosyltransferase exoenzyme [Mycobacterium marinum]
MCRSTKDGGRRCPGCGSYRAAAKANGNRRLGRLARKKVVDQLIAQGLVGTAKAILSAPPSILPEFMKAMEIDQSVLGGTPMPSAHSNPPSASLLIAAAKAEQSARASSQISPEEHALEQAEEALAAAENAADDARKAVQRAQARRRKLVREMGSAEGDSLTSEQLAQLAEAGEGIDTAKAIYAQAKLALPVAADDVVAAKYGVAATLPGEDRDAYFANLSSQDVDALARSLNRAVDAEAAAALDTGPQPALIAGAVRDTSIYTPAKFLMETGSGAVEVEGRLLDGGTALHRRGSGDFLILQKRDGVYHGVAAAGGKSAALNKANRIPILAELPALHEGASDTEMQAHHIKSQVLMQLAGQAAENHWNSEQHQSFLDDKMAEARDKLVDAVGAGPARADIYDATKRHKKLMREQAAVAAGESARAEALAGGKGIEAAAEAYAAAHRRVLGTPTRGGGVIPHFDHKIPPGSLGAEKHKSLWRSGIRAWGKETANDYAVIAQRSGNLNAWGFSASGPGIKTSSISELTAANAEFVQKALDNKERSALTTYTGGSYTAINAAICGRDGAAPSGSIKTVVSGIASAFDKFREHNPNMSPMTLVRGTKIPSGWTGTPAEYIDAVFPVGARMEVGKVTSTTTQQSTASAFAGHPPYYMVVRTREGLPVKSISKHSGEDEVILPMGSHLRCVHIDRKGIAGMPTVYLVGEDLVAEAEDSGAGSWKKAG